MSARPTLYELLETCESTEQQRVLLQAYEHHPLLRRAIAGERLSDAYSNVRSGAMHELYVLPRSELRDATTAAGITALALPFGLALSLPIMDVAFIGVTGLGLTFIATYSYRSMRECLTPPLAEQASCIDAILDRLQVRSPQRP